MLKYDQLITHQYCKYSLMLIQSVEWCDDKNVMLFIRLHARPPMTLFMHVLSDLLLKDFLVLKQY